MTDEREAVDAKPEPELHASIRMQEVEPQLGKRGKWFYVGWVVFWVVLLAVILLVYGLANY